MSLPPLEEKPGKSRPFQLSVETFSQKYLVTVFLNSRASLGLELSERKIDQSSSIVVFAERFNLSDAEREELLPAFREFYKNEHSVETVNSTPPIAPSKATPEEIVEAANNQAQAALRADLLDRIRQRLLHRRMIDVSAPLIL